MALTGELAWSVVCLMGAKLSESVLNDPLGDIERVAKLDSIVFLNEP